MGWLQWVVWQSQSSEEMKLEDFLPGKPKEISAKKDPVEFEKRLARMVAAAKRREERNKKKEAGPSTASAAADFGRDDNSSVR